MKLLTRPISDYKKIYNDLLWLDSNHKLRFIVEAKYNDRNKNTRYYASEYVTSNGSYVYLDLHYHLSIESINRDEISGLKTEFNIYNANIYQFIIALENASQWIVNKAYANIFAKMANGQIKCIAEIEPIEIIDVFKHKLTIQPGVLNTDAKNESGIVMFIDDSDLIFLNGAAFMNFKYFINNFNMHSTAMQILTWLGRDDDTPQQSQTVFTPPKRDTFLTRVNAKERKDE